MYNNSFTKILFENYSDSNFIGKLCLMLLMFFFVIVVGSFFKDLIYIFFTRYSLKRKLENRERKLLNVRKKYLDGKIDAKAYKIITKNIISNFN